MATLYPTLSAQVQTGAVDVSVTSAAGGAGQTVSYTGVTDSARVWNQDTNHKIEYQVGSGSWVSLDPNKEAVLDIDMSATTIKLRLSEFAPTGRAVQVIYNAKPHGVLVPDAEGMPMTLNNPALITWEPSPGLSSASANRLALQALLLGGNKIINVVGQGTYWFDDTMVVYSDTELVINAGVEIKLTGGAARRMLVNSAFQSPIFTPISSITATGNLITATKPGHPFVVGQWIFVEGVGARGYNGCVRVHTVTADSYSYFSPIAPTNLSPAVYAGPAMTGLTWAMQACPADVNITIRGGGTINWNGANQTFPPNIDTYAVLLHRVYSPKIYDITGKGALKYMFCVAGSNGLRARSIQIDTLSDGFNVEMPCFNAVVDGVSGIAGDDFVSILCGDTQPKTFTVGDGHNIVVNNLKSEGPGSLAAIKMAGCAPFVFDEVHGANITGTGRLSATIAIIDDLDMVGGSIGNVSFTNINRHITGASTNGEILQMRMTGLGGRIRIKNAAYNGTAGMGIRVDSAANIDSLDIDITCDKAVPALPLVQVFGTVSEVRQRVCTGPLFAGYIGQTAGAANVGVWFASGVWAGTTSAKGLYHSAGTISRVAYTGVMLTNVRTLYESESGAANDAIILMNNVAISGGLGLALLRRGASVYMDNVAAAYTQQAIIDSNNAFTVNAYCGASCTYSGNVFSNGAANTINVYGLSRIGAPGFSATPTFTLDNNNIINLGVMTANITAMTLARLPPAGERVVITLTQDGVGGRKVAWPASVVFPVPWVDAVATTDAGKKCTVSLVSSGTQLIAAPSKWAA